MRHLIAAVLLASASPLAAAPADFARQADAMVAAQAQAPGMAMLVTERGKPVWSRATGTAGGASVQTNSLFRYGSISKQFTAALILKLVEEGRFSVDDNLGKLLPDATPAAWHAVTVRQLLTHTSGIPSYTDVPGWMVESNFGKPHSTAELIALTASRPLDFAPGTKWRYNNTGYVLLSAIAEKMTGKPWHVSLREKVTGSLGLTSIRCGCEPGATTIPGYSGDKAADKIDMTVPSGAGALIGNVSDLAKWTEALHGGKVIRADLYKEMITPVKLADGKDHPYGFGLSVGDLNGMKTLAHGGGIPGFLTYVTYLPEQRVFAAVLGNNDGPVGGVTQSLANRFAAAAAGKPLPTFARQPLDEVAVSPFLSVYDLPAGGQRTLFVQDGKLMVRRNGPAAEALSAGNGRFFASGHSLNWFELTRSAAGTPQMLFYTNGSAKPEIAVWKSGIPAMAPAVALTAAQQQALVGSYAAGIGTMTIAQADGGLTGQLTGQPSIKLEAIGPRELRTVGIDARLVFEEADGKIKRLVLHQGGNTVPFERQ